MLNKFYYYAQLMRWHKPIGIFLLLWPTLWGIWFASHGKPSTSILIIFLTGVVIMRSAGCVINDYADRHIDGHIQRTQLRPLAQGLISSKEALVLFGLLLCIAAYLASQLNRSTFIFAFIGALLTIIYPFSKRFFVCPQLLLGIIFGGWPVLLAFTAIENHVPFYGWILFLAASLWPIVYDTLYAMTDRPDDLKIGIHSSAIWFGQYDKLIIAVLAIVMISCLIAVGLILKLNNWYYLSLLICSLLLCYQQWLIKNADNSKYFKAFLNNNYLGAVLFVGILLSFHA